MAAWPDVLGVWFDTAGSIAVLIGTCTCTCVCMSFSSLGVVAVVLEFDGEWGLRI